MKESFQSLEYTTKRSISIFPIAKLYMYNVQFKFNKNEYSVYKNEYIMSNTKFPLPTLPCDAKKITIVNFITAI